jgi:glycerol-3-phosphate dehydrogenase (NAD(P)+)
MTNVAVFGAGMWGTAFSLVLSDAGHRVALWGRRPELCASINAHRQNADYLPDVRLPDTLVASSEPERVLDDAEVVVLAVPAQSLRPNLEDWAAVLPVDALLVSLIKGVELGSAKRMSEVIREVTGATADRVAVITGPNLAGEIAARQPAASVVACSNADAAQRLQAVCHTPVFRPYTNSDVVGCELGGATKNVIALAVGMAVGLGFGDNARASVITRGLAETARLGHALGAEQYTFAGLAGLGDLVATCSSPLSRNRTFGERLAQGLTVEEISAGTRQVAEGVKSCQSILALASRHGVKVPIVEHVAAVVRGQLKPHEMLVSLMSRSAKPERY